MLELSCFPNGYGRFGPLAAMAHLPSVGIRLLELPIKNAGVPSFFKETPLLTEASTFDDVDRILDQVHSSGMGLSSCNISSGNPLDPAVVERTCQKLKLARHAGVSRVVGGGGEVSSPNDWPQLVRHLQLIGNAAADYGIVYCCETHPGAFQNASSMLESLQRIDHPHIRVNFDTGNIFYYNELPDLLQQLGDVLPWVSHVHLKDTNGQFKCWHFPALGEGGAVDFAAIRERLIAASYSGPVSLELEGIEGEPELLLTEYEARMARSVEHLRSLGW